MRVSGVSPKVARPAIALVAVAAVLLLAGAVLHDGTLATAGAAVLAAAGVQIPLGYGAPVGHVGPEPEPGSPSDTPPLLPGESADIGHGVPTDRPPPHTRTD